MDKLSKGIVYNKGDVVLEFFKDAACTNKITTWAEADGKFAVTYNTATNGDNIMTISMTDAGLMEINTNHNVYTGADMVNSGYSDCTLRITYAARVKSDDSFVYGDAGNPNEVALKWSRTNSSYYDTLIDDAHQNLEKSRSLKSEHLAVCQMPSFLVSSSKSLRRNIRIQKREIS